MNINKSFINSLSFTGKETTYFDDAIKGFGVRVCKSSASYILMYRNAYGRQKKLTICKTTLMTPTEARDEAKWLLALVVQGKDPEQEKLERRKELTIGELADEFLCGVCSITPVLWDRWTSIRSRSCRLSPIRAVTSSLTKRKSESSAKS